MFEFFDSSQFMPHGHCYLWNSALLGLHVTANAIIAGSYFTIPLVLLQLVRRRKDLAFNWIFVMFAVFILACGTTHVMDVITIWKPYYWFDGMVRAITAMASLGTAILLWPLLPKVLALPGVSEMARVNQELQAQIEERIKAEEQLRLLHKDLECLVETRTTELNQANSALKLDIVERKAIKFDQARLAAMVESSDDAIIGKDLDGRISSWNRGAEKIFGYQADEVIGRSIDILFPHKEAGYLHEIMAAVRRGEPIQHHETERVRKDGRHIFVSISISPFRDQSGQICGVTKIARDITEKKLVEDKARRWESIFTHAGWAVALIQPSDGRMETVNPCFAAMHGYSLEELTGQALAAVVAPEDVGKLPAIIKTIETEGSHRFELTHIRKDGQKFPVLITASIYADEKGQVRFYAATLQDISEQKASQQKVENAIRELMRSNTDLEQFSYVASHDLQEPLRKIASFSQLLAQEHRESLHGEALDYLNFIVDGAQRMQILIEDLLEFSRIGIDESRKKSVDLGGVLKQVLETLELPMQEAEAEVTSDVLPSVYGDESDLVRVLQNLLANAIKYRSERPPRIHISCVPSGSKWLFCLRDNGIGIDPRHLSSIFIIFKRLHGKNKYPGTGIGLAICKKVIERHGGSIWAESNGKDGTSFYFTLPISREVAHAE